MVGDLIYLFEWLIRRCFIFPEIGGATGGKPLCNAIV
jgi:hypothetical protein